MRTYFEANLLPIKSEQMVLLFLVALFCRHTVDDGKISVSHVECEECACVCAYDEHY